MTDVILSEHQPKKEKLLFRMFSKTVGMITSHTFETSEQLLAKFFPDQSTLVHFTGVDEFDQPVEHYFDSRKSTETGDIFALVIVPLKDRKVLPVEAQVTGRGPMKVH